MDCHFRTDHRVHKQTPAFEGSCSTRPRGKRLDPIGVPVQSQDISLASHLRQDFALVAIEFGSRVSAKLVDELKL
ncbi:hypothetical protein AeMF1_008447 [Aphanomyces euteiches]|nr:hypothetical protein AeMF1_008447 [Aphanomyces euteiches]